MYKLETRQLSKVFSRGQRTVEALRDVSIGIAAGEFVSIVGASGCGKTTFLRTVDGLIEPSKGSILIDGKTITGPSSDRAFVFQRDSLFPWRSVLQNTVFGPEIRGDDMRSARTLAQRFLALVSLAGFDKYFPHEISGGMRQRVNLARALTVDPEVLLMDEPFAALDSQTREIMQAELLRIWQEAKKTVLFVTHQIDEAVFLSDRVLVFTVRPGRLKQIITIDLPRPRALEIKRTPEFVRYVDQIWRLIEEEVRQSARPDMAQPLQA
jgi:ABC-type nitrate/sulfonate/bicarbonate transport system ATPase subunit